MTKEEAKLKIQKIVFAEITCGVEMYVCLKENDGFIIEKMVTMTPLKNRIRELVKRVLETNYLDVNIEYEDVTNISDNKKSIYMLEQSPSYIPFILLQSELIVQNFKEDNMDRVLGFFFQMNRNDDKFFVYQQAYVGSKLKAHNALRIIHKGEDKFDTFDENLLKLDNRADFIVIDNEILIKNIKVLQDNFGFQTYVRAEAQNVIESIEELDIVSNIEKIKACQMEEKLTNSKKLMKIKNSPVLKMDREVLLDKIPRIQRYASIIKIEDGKIKTTSKQDVNNLLKLLNDDYVKSELTEQEYDSPTKNLLEDEVH